MRSEIVSLHRRLGSTIVFVTHDQVEAMTMADRIVVLRDGVTEQAGTPIELYARPCNRFVAGFLGAPRMNMLSAHVAEIDASGIVATVDQERSKTRAAVAGSESVIGQSCIVGVRPEHLVPSDVGQLHVRVDATEMLGAETIMHASLRSGERITASLRGIHRLRDNSVMAFSVDPRFVHVFSQDGSALTPLRSWREDYLAAIPHAEPLPLYTTPHGERRETKHQGPVSA
jgi:ABC-type sugar transport system ATPase subunit